jgi:hypothetical protein
MDDGRLVFQQSFNSSSKDLGSMNMMAVLDPKTKKMYVMLSDGHDLMGMTPPGYDDFLNVLPIQVVDVGKSQQRVYPKSEANVASAVRENTADLEARSGIPRRKGETVTQYEDRVIREFKAEPTLRQRAGATYDAAALAATPQKVSGMFTAEDPSMYRSDGSKKSATGYLGPIENLVTGGTMTEFTTEWEDMGIEIPTMVPTLSSEEIKYMQRMVPGQGWDRSKPMDKSILQKAKDHARMRLEQGKSPYYQDGEKRGR